MSPFDRSEKVGAEVIEAPVVPKPEPEALKPEATRESRAAEHNQLYSMYNRGSITREGMERLTNLRREMMQRGEMPCDCTVSRADMLIVSTPLA